MNLFIGAIAIVGIIIMIIFIMVCWKGDCDDEGDLGIDSYRN